MFDFGGEFGAGFVFSEDSQRLRRIIDSVVEDPSGRLDLSKAVDLTDEIGKQGTFACHVILARLYERLYRRTGLYLSLELLDFCVRNCGLDFAKYIKREFLQAMTRLLKMSSLNEQTFAGAVNSTLRMLTQPIFAPQQTPPISKDVVLVRCQKKILFLLQLWADSFMMHEEMVSDIIDTYRKLRKKGYVFPPKDPKQKFLVKHAAASPVFEPGNISSSENPPLSSSSSSTKPLSLPSSPHCLTDSQMHQLSKSLVIIKSDNVSFESKIRCARICSVILEKLVSKTHETATSTTPDSKRLSELIDLQREIEAAIASVLQQQQQAVPFPLSWPNQASSSLDFSDCPSAVENGVTTHTALRGNPLSSQDAIGTQSLRRRRRAERPPSSQFRTETNSSQGHEENQESGVAADESQQAWDPFGVASVASRIPLNNSSSNSKLKTCDTGQVVVPLLPPPPQAIRHTVTRSNPKPLLDLFALHDDETETDAGKLEIGSHENAPQSGSNPDVMGHQRHDFRVGESKSDLRIQGVASTSNQPTKTLVELQKIFPPSQSE